ncbi:MAG: hypothetical protein V4653_05010 [Pseudomonadota bacterium]
MTLAGCGGTDPRTTITRVFGPSTEGREPPPGLEAGTPYPAIGSVPARPARTDAALRLALTEELARQRAVSRIEVPAAAAARLPVGARPVAGLPGPPERPRLGPSAVVGLPAPDAPVLPRSAPQTPVPEAPRTLAPAPPSADLLAPGAPALPGSDLLAPPRLP